MEIALQGDSKGIVYEGYTKAFKQCIFEEGDVSGRNERYEFRCDYDLECCGRTCCIPEPATIPLWLMIIFLILLLILLAAALLTLAYICAKRRKPKPKKDHSESGATKSGYAALQTTNDDYRNGYAHGGRDRAALVRENEAYSTPDNLYGGYGSRTYDGTNRSYGGGRGGYGGYGGESREIAVRRDLAPPPRRDSRATVTSDGGSLVRHGVHETVEESFKQEVTYERPASTDSEEML